MKKYIFVLLPIVTMLQAMDNTRITWNQNMYSAVTLLQGTSRNGFIDIEEIKKMTALIEMIKNHKECVAPVNNSPCQLLAPSSIKQESLQMIEDFIGAFNGRFYMTTDNLESRYYFDEKNVDVVWVSQKILTQCHIKTEAKPMYPHKILLELGGAGSNVVNMTFIKLDENKKYLFTIQDGKIVGDGVMPI